MYFGKGNPEKSITGYCVNVETLDDIKNYEAPQYENTTLKDSMEFFGENSIYVKAGAGENLWKISGRMG